MKKEKFLEKVKNKNYNAILEEGIVKIFVENASDIKPVYKEIKELAKTNKYDKSFGIFLEKRRLNIFKTITKINPAFYRRIFSLLKGFHFYRMWRSLLFFL